MTVTSHRRSKSIKKLLKKINRAASLLVISRKTSLGEGQFAMHRNMFLENSHVLFGLFVSIYLSGVLVNYIVAVKLSSLSL